MQYSRLLSATLIASKHKKLGVGLDEDSPTKAVFSIVKGIAVATGNTLLFSFGLYCV